MLREWGAILGFEGEFGKPEPKVFASYWAMLWGRGVAQTQKGHVCRVSEQDDELQSEDFMALEGGG